MLVAVPEKSGPSAAEATKTVIKTTDTSLSDFYFLPSEAEKKIIQMGFYPSLIVVSPLGWHGANDGVSFVVNIPTIEGEFYQFFIGSSVVPWEDFICYSRYRREVKYTKLTHINQQ